MKENVQRLWTPEKPENQGLKLECLKIASGGALKANASEILPEAQKMYEWLTNKANDNGSSQ